MDNDEQRDHAEEQYNRDLLNKGDGDEQADWPCSCEGAGCENCQPDRFRTEFLKWSADGAKSLPEVAERLRAVAANLDQLALDGWQVTGEVDGGFIPLSWSPPDSSEVG